ncbi:hypothetical protein Pcinc_010195 [Petrolisthes cinctipes]|uniref:PiggyBac transposable element-derived protein domain-containing protein n=1 Tax=Petrolisthes cinctipes TaxID=88211 RepID=A0AAE1G5E9_PETCI|nr:hypothetical protein Pcinc_010195 [Petrolisthes cinctipes]
MSSKRFKQIRALLHFNNNENAKSSTDRFYKVRPLFSGITKQFLQVKTTPTQSIDEVMGATTFSSHPVDLCEDEEQQLMSSKLVLVLAKTIQDLKNTTIYADNYFTSIQLIEFLRDKYQCRYVGTARPNRTGNPPLMSKKEMEKKSTPRGTLDYVSCNGVLAMCWKDNKQVTVLSSDAGVEPLSTAKRWNKDTRKEVEVQCPAVIKEYNRKMRGIDKSNMLTHLYKTPMKSRRWYIRLYGYVVDLCISNAWVLYKRDAIALLEKPMPLKNFRLEISTFALSYKNRPARMIRNTPEPFVLPKRGQRTSLPSDNLRYDFSKFHCPEIVKQRMTCKFCSTKDDLHRSRWICNVCKVALCLTDSRNCFQTFHTGPSSSSASTSALPASPTSVTLSGTPASSP